MGFDSLNVQKPGLPTLLVFFLLTCLMLPFALLRVFFERLTNRNCDGRD